MEEIINKLDIRIIRKINLADILNPDCQYFSESLRVQGRVESILGDNGGNDEFYFTTFV